MRRLSQYGGGSNVSLVMSPNLILDMRAAVKPVITQIHVGREFVEDVSVPRLGPDVPQWAGETIGFWDNDALITWTSNIQGWIAHGSAEFSNRLQSIESYTPRRNAATGALIGLRHEVVLYDEDALVEPVRIVHYLDRLSGHDTGDPFPINECVPTIFPIDGHSTPVTPGQTFEFKLPDIYGRPWAEIWENYHESGMERPQSEDIFDFQ